MAAEPPLDPALVLGLDLVVELVRDPLADLGEHRAGVEAGRELLDDRADQAEVAQAAFDRLARAGALDLDRDVVALAGARAMDLAERA